MNNQQTQTKPVVHAEWIPKKILFKGYVCSNCRVYKEFIHEICPLCGAIMDGKENNAISANDTQC